MNPSRLVALLPLVALLGGCGSTPHDEAAQSSEESLTSYKSGVMSASGLALVQSLMGTGSASASATEAAIHFAPSPQMAAIGAPPIDYASTDFRDYGNNVGVRIKSFTQLGAPTFAFEASGPGSIDMHLVLTGDLYLLGGFCYTSYPYCITGSPNGGQPLPKFFALLTGTATVDVRFVVDANGVLGVDAVNASFPYVLSEPTQPFQVNLEALAASEHASIEMWMADEIKNALAQALASHQSVWIGGLNQYVNYARVAVGPLQQPAWQVIPPSLSIAGGGMAWTAKRETATTAPTGCKASTACEGFVIVTCTPSTDRLELELLSGGQWVAEFQEPVSASTSYAFSFTAKGAAWLPLRVCAVNATGKSCGATMNVVPNNTHCPPLCTRDGAGVLHCVGSGSGSGL